MSSRDPDPPCSDDACPVPIPDHAHPHADTESLPTPKTTPDTVAGWTRVYTTRTVYVWQRTAASGPWVRLTYDCRRHGWHADRLTTDTTTTGTPPTVTWLTDPDPTAPVNGIPDAHRPPADTDTDATTATDTRLPVMFGSALTVALHHMMQTGTADT